MERTIIDLRKQLKDQDKPSPSPRIVKKKEHTPPKVPAAEVIAKKKQDREREFTKEQLELEEKMIHDS